MRLCVIENRHSPPADVRREHADTLIVLAPMVVPARTDVVEGEDARPSSPEGNSGARDPLGESLGDRGLPDAGRPDERRIVLAVAEQDVDDAGDLLGPATDRLEPAVPCVERQVAREPGEDIVIPRKQHSGRSTSGASGSENDVVIPLPQVASPKQRQQRGGRKEDTDERRCSNSSSRAASAASDRIYQHTNVTAPRPPITREQA